MRAAKIRLNNTLFILALTLVSVGIIIVLIIANSRPLEKCSSLISIHKSSIIIDAGHGGADGGAVSSNGTQEARINLDISNKLKDFFTFIGIRSVMTRTDEQSLNWSADNTIRQNKNADLKARLNMSVKMPECDFLSIHLNKFEQSDCFGAQVFFSPNNEGSSVLAECIQGSFSLYLDKDNKRIAKKCPDNVYLMKNIKSPAVTIECGFLSNPEEEKKLADNRYQTQIALAIAKGYIDYLKDR